MPDYPGFGGTLRPRRTQLLPGLIGLAGAVLLTVMMHLAGWGIVMTVALAGLAGFALVFFMLNWWRVRFEIHGQSVHYYPAIGRMHRLDPTTVAEVVSLHLRSPGSKATEWFTMVIGADGRRICSLTTPIWPPAALEPVLALLVRSGVTRAVIEEPVRVRDLPARYADLLPWPRRHVGVLIALIMVTMLVLMVISSLVG